MDCKQYRGLHDPQACRRCLLDLSRASELSPEFEHTRGNPGAKKPQPKVVGARATEQLAQPKRPTVLPWSACGVRASKLNRPVLGIAHMHDGRHQCRLLGVVCICASNIPRT